MIPKKPSNVIWSDEQWKAIHLDGSNILVSAGAGSGKTAVLSQRVLTKLKNGVSLRNLIILTFTNAAAIEMKERIRREINKEIVNGNEKLTEEYDYLDQANIQTFDSFALELVRKYHYLLNVSRDISICDDSMLVLKTKEIVDEVFKKHYDDNDEMFNKMIKYYCIKDDDIIKDGVIRINNSLELLANRNEYVGSYQRKFFSLEFYDKMKEEFVNNLLNEVGNIKSIIESLYKICSDKESIDYINKLNDSLKGLYKCEKYEEFYRLEIKTPNVSNKIPLEEKEIIKREKELISKIIKNIKDICLYETIDVFHNKSLQTKDFSLKLLELVEEVNDKLLLFKREYNIFSFMDIAKMAIELMENNEDLREYYKNKTNEILVDEYQDTSDIQERLIELISNNNVYMVGDVKQSIYRFRNANPSIFSNKYFNYYHHNGGELIELSKNFRSRKEVLDNINIIFSKVMNSNYGGADYNNGHALVYGNLKYSDFIDHDNNFEIFNIDYDNSELNRYELEATIIARDIKKKIKGGYRVFNGKELVKCSYKDFAILTQSKTNFDVYRKVFENYSIPLYVHKDESFSSSYDIVSVISCMKVVNYLYNKTYNDDFKYSLCSFLRSFIVEIDDNDLCEILLSNNIFDGLKLYCKDVYEKLLYLVNYYSLNTYSDLMYEIYKVFDVYGKIYKLNDIDNVEDRLNYLLSKCSEFSKIGNDINQFLDYFNKVKEEGIEITLSSKGSKVSDAVNMLSIHKSKGLEYNICYFPELNGLFRLPELKEKIIFDKEYGIILPFYDEGLVDSYYKTLLKARMIREEISEKIRLFYVALTRAKDKFILLSKGFEAGYGEIDYSDYYKEKYNSFYSILDSVRFYLGNYFINPLYNNYNDVLDDSEIDSFNNKTIINFYDLQFEEVNLNKSHASMEIKGVINSEVKKKMEFGTKIHHYLEVIDINNYCSDINSINESDYIKNKIKIFYDKFFKLGLNVKKVYNEYEFIYNRNSNLIHGIIDMLVECDDEMVIIDYKLSDIDKDGYVLQLNTYKEYIEYLTGKKVRIYLYSIIKEEFKEL